MTETGIEASGKATLQHIVLLQDKQRRLAAAQEQAEQQLLHRYGSAHRAGEITITQLLDFFQEYRKLDIPGRSHRWNENVDLIYQTCSLLQPPNGPEGTWVGEWPCGDADPCPLRGVAVVYVLFGQDNEPCYVGSTNHFRTRMGNHVKAGKVFSRWQAYPWPTREAAYVLEERLLNERMPNLNRRKGR
ncbi:GIY-YIG nuclease family protein [Streptomyces sp. NPDC093097]|uniref:GIY-YIG nuclease family protein n=1 Tax=Streptomyces sp. NPDC093097 TaxID=3366027 RepID=UPI0037F95AAA